MHEALAHKLKKKNRPNVENVTSSVSALILQILLRCIVVACVDNLYIDFTYR